MATTQQAHIQSCGSEQKQTNQRVGIIGPLIQRDVVLHVVVVYGLVLNHNTDMKEGLIQLVLLNYC